MNTLDTRDLYKRKCELESLRDAVAEAKEALDEAGYPATTPRDQIRDEDEHLIETLDNAQDEYGKDEQTELAELEALENEMDARTFRDGETLIPEDDFEEYARELAEDVHGDAVRNAEWPFTCIDWEQAARDLQQDYSTAEYQGETYYFRA